MDRTKRILSAVLVLAFVLLMIPPDAVRAAKVKTEGFENGNGLDLDKIGAYISGTSNPDGGVAEIISYDAANNKAWVVNGATGMLDILDLNNMEGGTITAASLDVKAMALEMNPGFLYGDMTSVSVCSDLQLVAVALQAEDYDAAGYVPDYFNCSNDDNDYDSRSPKKGPEPESVTVGTIANDLYAFIALERIGGIMVYRIDAEGETASFVNYINTRDFSEDPGEADPHLTSDVAPEGLYFIPESGILLAAFEVSGTVSAYAVTAAAADQADVPEATLPVVTDTADDSNSECAWMIWGAVIAVIAVAVLLIRKE